MSSGGELVVFIRGVEIVFLSSIHFTDTLPATIGPIDHSLPWIQAQVLSFLAEETTADIVGVFLHLLVAFEKVGKDVDIGKTFQSSSMLGGQMDDDSLDRLAFEKFKELQACRVEKVISGHRFVDQSDDGLKDFVLDELLVVKVLLAAEA